MKNALKTEVWPQPPFSVAQPMPEPEAQDSLWAKWLGQVLAFGAFGPALYQWALVLYRLGLFWLEDNGQLGVNHSDDFRDVYTMDAWAVPVSLLAALLLWRQHGRGKNLSLAILAANILGASAFFMMHQTGVLVTYSEYIGR